MNVQYANVECFDKPVAVEVVRELPQHIVVQSLEGERVWQRRLHRKTEPLFPTFEEAKAARQ